MDKEHVKGAADKASGTIKEGVGKAVGDTSLEAKGKIDKAKGEGREMLGDAKDAIRKSDDRPN